MFNVTNKLNKDFKYYYDMAEEGATKYTKVENELIKAALIMSCGFIIIIVVFVILAQSPKDKIEYGKAGKKIPKDIPYFRDIPGKGDIFRSYYIGYRYKVIEKKTDVLGAIILKWLKDGVIRIEEKEERSVFKKENTVIVLKDTDLKMIVEPKEEELFKMLKSASKDGYLENKEFEEWCKTSHSKILSWFDEIIYREEKELLKEGLIRIKEKSFMKKVREATPELKQEAIELAGLKRYLKEYSFIKEREAIEVKLFEEYLIFAQMMGIAEKVAKQFKKLYPEIIEQSNFTSYNYILYINMNSLRGVAAAKSAREIEKARERASNYSSGGGGFSSGGGGGGSFGGGGGGRRLPLKFPLTPSLW